MGFSSNFIWRLVLINLAFFVMSVTSATNAGPQLPSESQLPSGPQLPSGKLITPPYLKLSNEGVLTLHPSYLLMGIIYQSEWRGNIFTCWKIDRTPININSAGVWKGDPDSATPTIAPTEVLLGYGNMKEGRPRCGPSHGAEFNGYVYFDATPLIESLERLRQRDDTLSFNILRWSLRYERRGLSAYNNNNADCLAHPIRRSPLYAIARGGPFTPPDLLASRAIAGRTIRSTSTIDDQPFEHYIRDHVVQGGFNEIETLTNGNAEIEWVPYEGTELNPPAIGDEPLIPFWLISLRPTNFGANDDCLAAVGNFRLNIHYRRGN